MKKYLCIVLFVLSVHGAVAESFFAADNPLIRYSGRIDFTDAKRPRFWAAGVTVSAAFEGTKLEFVIEDEVLWGKTHNYLEVIIDGQKLYRLQTKGRRDTIRVVDHLAPGRHTIVICKNTEALMGYIRFIGFYCDSLVALPTAAAHRIELIGDSITSGSGSDLSAVPCDKGEWYDQHNAWLSYGARAARALGAEWHLTSESGIGLIHSCCEKQFTMPQIFDKVSISKDSMVWDFNRYQPEVVTVCLGQNDGKQDSLRFTSAYVDFLLQLRTRYPGATLICLSSPMANQSLRATFHAYLPAVVAHMRKKGDKNVTSYEFLKSYNNGCGGHPDLRDHEGIARELTAFIARRMKWNVK